MRCFFSQFGKVLQVRVSRNKEQKSRGYGYVKFASRAVAKIAAETMNNYLMFNKILKVSYLETWNDNLFWHGCEYERQPTPHRAIYREEYNAPKNEEKWEAEMETVKSARLRTLGKLKDLGYEYEMPLCFTMHQWTVTRQKTQRMQRATRQRVNNRICVPVLSLTDRRCPYHRRAFL